MCHVYVAQQLCGELSDRLIIMCSVLGRSTVADPGFSRIDPG